MYDINKEIEENKGLAYRQLWKFHMVDDPDAESIALEALFRAITTFDESSNVKLSTYASVVIYNALGCYLRKLKSKKNTEVISYNRIACVDEHGAHEFFEFMPSDTDIEGDYVHKEMCRLAMEAFDELYEKLTTQSHKDILKAWKDSEFTSTTQQISKDVGVSQSYVSRTINEFKAKLKKKLGRTYYD